MTRRAAVTAMWVVCTVAVFFVPGPEVEIGRTVDGDSMGVSVLPLSWLVGGTSLLIGVLVISAFAVRRRRALRRAPR